MGRLFDSGYLTFHFSFCEENHGKKKEVFLKMYNLPPGSLEKGVDSIYGVGTLQKTGIISGGKCIITGENAGGVYSNGGTISGGE